MTDLAHSLGRAKIHGQAVDAMPLPGWLWPVAEDMAEMPAAICAMHLCTGISDLVVDRSAHRTLLNRSPERGPSGPAVIFGP